MLNICTFIGHLGADPDIKRTQDGRPICNLSLAVSESWKDKNTGERKERTEWVKVVIFSEGLAKVAEQYLKKGSKVFISGKMQTRKWQDNSSQDKWTTEIVLQGFDAKLVMLDGKPQSNQQVANTNDYANVSQGGSYQEQSGGSSNGGFNGQPSGNIDDEIPF